MTERFEGENTLLEVEELERQDRIRGQELLRIIDFGLQVKQFMAGEIYRRMKQDADVESAELTQGLMTVDTDTPAGKLEERRIKLRHAVVNQWQTWFIEYLAEAEAAEVAFHEGEKAIEPGE